MAALRRWTLRAKFLLAASVTLLALIGATLVYVSWQADRLVGQRIAADLEGSTAIVSAAEADRFSTLELTAQVIAAFPALRALLETTDAATIRDVLVEYLQRTDRADLLIALSPNADTLARTDAIALLDVHDAQQRWIAPLVGGRRPRGYLTTDNAIYQVSAASADAAGTLFGVLLVGARVDDALAQKLRASTNEDVVILSPDRIVASTIPVAELPWTSGTVWASMHAAANASVPVTIRGEEFSVHATPGIDASLTYLTLQSRDRALAPYRQIQRGLLLLGVVAVALGVGASAFLARNITAPVARIVEGTRQVAAGNYDVSVDVQGDDELGRLADSFNSMTRGLKERADMQKFMSQTTLEMIQSKSEQRSGERRNMTILFSDVRGFSRFAEQRPPEEAVAWLNQCLGVQADLIRRHHGDVDKYVGDAVFAMFDGDDMAFDAVRCAVDIHHRMDALEAPDGAPLELGIGVVTGEVLLGSIGSADRMDYTAIGHQVNLCSRLCSMAGPREILIAGSTYALVRDVISAEHLEAVAVKGLAQPADVYRMVIPRAVA